MATGSEAKYRQHDRLEEYIGQAMEDKFSDGNGYFEAVIKNNETGIRVELDYEQEPDEHKNNFRGELNLTVYSGGDVIEEKNTSADVVEKNGKYLLYEINKPRRHKKLRTVLEETIEFSGGIASHVKPRRLSMVNNLDENLRIRYAIESYNELPIDNTEETEKWRELKENLNADGASEWNNMEEVKKKLEDPDCNDLVLNINSGEP